MTFVKSQVAEGKSVLFIEPSVQQVQSSQNKLKDVVNFMSQQQIIGWNSYQLQDDQNLDRQVGSNGTRNGIWRVGTTNQERKIGS